MLERNAFLVLTLLAALSCSEADPAAEDEGEPVSPITDLSTGALCPEDSELTWESFGRSFITDYCIRCHTNQLEGATRLAPPGADFNALPTVRGLAHQIDRQAAAGPKGNHVGMPPSEPFPAMDDREKLGHWLACGAPGKGTSMAFSLEAGAAGSGASP